MPSAILYLILPAILVVWLAKRPINDGAKFMWLVALGYKIFCACGMTYLLINDWDFGDLYTYFGQARETAGSLKLFTEIAERSPVATLNAIIFTVLPPSIYGLSIVAGCASFLFIYWVIEGFRRFFVVPKIVELTLYFAPTFSISCGYIGKETYVLPALGLVIYLYEPVLNRWLLKAALLAVWIWAFRTYQMLFFVVALSATWLGLRKSWKAIVVLPCIGALLYGIARTFVEQRDFLTSSLSEALEISYAGGNLMLPPYPVPFTWLQHFRPFPWEAHKISALLASFEYLWFLALAIGLLWKIKWSRVWAVVRPEHQRLIYFAGTWFFIYFVVYAFSSNLGDMSRRHIYYYPFMLLILCPMRELVPMAALLSRRPDVRANFNSRGHDPRLHVLRRGQPRS